MSSERRELAFMISMDGKTEDELADEIHEAVQARWRATGEVEPEQEDE